MRNEEEATEKKQDSATNIQPTRDKHAFIIRMGLVGLPLVELG